MGDLLGYMLGFMGYMRYMGDLLGYMHFLVIRKKVDKSSRNLSADFVPFSTMLRSNICHTSLRHDI